MLSFIARNGVWRLVGRGGVVGALLPRLVSTFVTKAGIPSLAPTPRCSQDCRPLGAGCWRVLLVPAPGSHLGVRMDRGRAGYCVSAMWAAGKPAGQVLHLNRILIGQRASYEGGGGRKSTAISFRHGVAPSLFHSWGN